MAKSKAESKAESKAKSRAESKAKSKATYIIGGGIIGLCCGLWLLRAGKKVVIITPIEPADTTAVASCGVLAISEVVPHSQPGIWWRYPIWWFDPLGPITIRGTAVISMLPWLLRFARSARHWRAIAKALAAINNRALADYQELLTAINCQHLIGSNPVLFIYRNAREWRQGQQHLAVQRQFGFDLQTLSAAAAQEIEPALATSLHRAVIFPEWRTVISTQRLLTDLASAFRRAGGEIITDRVSRIQRSGNAVAGLELERGGSCSGQNYVFATGAWSQQLLAQIGIKVMIAGIIGYQAILTDPGIDLQHSIFLPSSGFGISSFQGHVGVAGTLEVASINARPNYRRIEILIQQAKEMLPQLAVHSQQLRIGRRPMCPDSLPVIDNEQLSNAVIAAGHGQLGVTQAATTGKLVAQAIEGQQIKFDLHPYRAARFASRKLIPA